MSDDINVNMIADQLAKKVDLPDNKGQDGIDYVIDWKRPTESDPTWYRVYKSGWVEQGGYIPTVSGMSFVVNFQKEMLDINYSFSKTMYTNSGNNVQYSQVSFYTKTTTTLTTNTAGVGFSWEVKGQGANQ